MTPALPSLGLNLAGLHPQDKVLLAREAEEAGFHYVTVGDNIDDAFVSLASIASTTTRIRLVSSVATWTRTPVTTARACRNLDLLSDGRFILGLGSMPRRWNEEFHGIPGRAALSRMREFVSLVRILWSASPAEPVSYLGRFYRVSGYRVALPPPQRPLSVFIGAARLRTIRETGAWAEGILFNGSYTIPWIEKRALPTLSEGAVEAGRSPGDLKLVAGRFVFLTEGPEQVEVAKAAFRRTWAAFPMRIDYHQQLMASIGFEREIARAVTCLAAGDEQGLLDAISDRMVDTYAIIGPAEECMRRVSEYAALFDWFTLMPATQGLPRPDRVAAIRRLVRQFGDLI